MDKMSLKTTLPKTSKSDDTLKQMLEAMTKRIENIGDRVERIGSKVSDLETRRIELSQEKPVSEK